MVKPKSLTVAWISSAFSDPVLLGVVPEGTKAEDVERWLPATMGKQRMITKNVITTLKMKLRNK